MPHEEAILVSPLDEMMEQELVKANVTDAVINSLSSKYGNLRLRSVTDKEKYLEIKDAAKECAKIRNLAVKCCKAGREEAVAIQKKWVAKEKEVVNKIADIEAPLDAEIERFDNEVKHQQELEKQRQEQQYMQRAQALTKMGALYSDNSFVLGDFSLEANLVKESSQEVWDDEILPNFNEQFFVLEAERIEQERVKAEKEAEMKRQQEELLQKQRDFEAQQAEFQKERQRLARDADKKRAISIEKRSAQLSELGLRFNVREYYFGDVTVTPAQVHDLSDEDFAELVKTITPKIESAIAEDQKKQQEEIENQKVAAAEKAAKAEREKIEQERAQAEEKRRLDELKKAEELAKAGDKALWADFIDKLSKVHVPKLKSGQYRRIGGIAQDKMEAILSLKPY